MLTSSPCCLWNSISARRPAGVRQSVVDRLARARIGKQDGEKVYLPPSPLPLPPAAGPWRHRSQPLSTRSRRMVVDDWRSFQHIQNVQRSWGIEAKFAPARTAAVAAAQRRITGPASLTRASSSTAASARCSA